jgi:PAS domain S-box-containing protein
LQQAILPKWSEKFWMILETNLTAATLLSQNRSALLKQPLSRYILPDDQDIYYLHRNQLFETGEPQTCDLRMVKNDGTQFWAHLAATAGQDIDCALVCRVVISDITERKIAETQIQGAREYAENIVENVHEPLLVLNSDLKILTANHSFYDTFKVGPEEIIGNFIYDIGNRQWDIPKLRILFEEILPHDTVFNGYEVEHDFLNIGRKTILLNARQIFRENIGSQIILLAMEDITERKRAEAEKAELEARNRQLQKAESLGRMAGAIFHRRHLILSADKKCSYIISPVIYVWT